MGIALLMRMALAALVAHGALGGSAPVEPMAGNAADAAENAADAERATVALAREEHFVLELAEEDLALHGGPRGASPVGVAACRLWRGADADGAPREQLEWEIRFHEPDAPDTRILHVERLEHERSKLVWRTWRPGEGRTLIAEWTDSREELRVLEWGGRERVREEIDASGGAVMPLYLQELARRGDVRSGRYRLFDPLSRTLEPVRVVGYVDAAAPAAGPGGAGGAGGQRLVELQRDDGSLAAAWLFDDAGLRAFQWQAGSLRGRRITREEYLLRAHDLR